MNDEDFHNGIVKQNFRMIELLEKILEENIDTNKVLNEDVNRELREIKVRLHDIQQ